MSNTCFLEDAATVSHYQMIPYWNAIRGTRLFSCNVVAVQNRNGKIFLGWNASRTLMNEVKSFLAGCLFELIAEAM